MLILVTSNQQARRKGLILQCLFGQIRVEKVVDNLFENEIANSVRGKRLHQNLDTDFDQVSD